MDELTESAGMRTEKSIRLRKQEIVFVTGRIKIHTTVVISLFTGYFPISR
jgi:hypothetical protein